MESLFVVNCPYCGEDVEIYLEPDVRGTLGCRSRRASVTWT
jgi:hypothetical protein